MLWQRLMRLLTLSSISKSMSGRLTSLLATLDAASYPLEQRCTTRTDLLHLDKAIGMLV
jgi:hypothetical protein